MMLHPHRLIAATLAALLTVAVSVGAVHAVAHEHEAACSVCVLSHHAPAVAANAAPAAAPPQRAETIAIVVSEPVRPSMRITRGGRAPPHTTAASTPRDA